MTFKYGEGSHEKSPGVLNPELETRNPKLETRNSELGTRNAF
jgi:hypothetical protein